jgi:hypothetical protein
MLVTAGNLPWRLGPADEKTGCASGVSPSTQVFDCQSTFTCSIYQFCCHLGHPSMSGALYKVFSYVESFKERNFRPILKKKKKKKKKTGGPHLVGCTLLLI